MNEEEIVNWMTQKNYNPIDYEIANGKVNTAYGMNLGCSRLLEIPFKFGRIEGNFDISENPINSLVNSPDRVAGSFDASETNIQDLTGGPIYTMRYDVGSCSSLISLKGAPKVVTDFIGRNCSRLKPSGCIPLLFSIVIGHVFISKNFDFILENDRDENGVMPREFIPTKINQLRELEEYYDAR